MEWFWIAAAGVSAVMCGVHVFAGGPAIAKPLLEARDIHAVAKYTNYYCWHLVTVAIALMAAAFLWAGMAPGQIGLGVLATVAAASFMVWGLVLPPMVGQRYAQMPQGWLFLPVAVLGGFGFA